MRIDVFSDIICPWCYIGRARLGRAIASFAHADAVQVRHRAFELDPRWPHGELVPVAEMLAKKLGPAASAAEDRVASIAASDGLSYHRDRVVGNTVDLHRLLRFARMGGAEQELLRQMLEAYFGRGENIFDPEVGAALAASAGLDADQALRVLHDEARLLPEVREDERAAAELGIRGVPFFIAAERFALSGAQPLEVFSEVIERAWSEGGTRLRSDV